MAVTIKLEEQTAAALEAQARVRGISVDAYLRQIAEMDRSVPLPPIEDPGSESARDFDAALDELFASDTRPLPATPLTHSRDDIYFDHD